MLSVEDLRARIDDLACLIDEFKLAEASLHGDGWKVAFKKRSARSAKAKELDAEEAPGETSTREELAVPAAVAEIPVGVPVSSPMNGIFYASPSPSSPPFVKEGEPVTAGQVVALIEAMKVFNEITAPTSGTVSKVLAETGQVVQPGEPLLYIG
jgi:acetyl-CoA carboxylase biotin carboxyl carrier protein